MTTLQRFPTLPLMLTIHRIRSYEVDMMIRLVVEWTKAHPASAKVPLNSLASELEHLGLVEKAIKIIEQYIKEFENYLKVRVASGDLDAKTANDRLRYLRVALEELGYVLTKQGLCSLIRKYQAEEPGVADHIYKALKLFVKEVVQNRELLQSIPYPRIR